ncbi:MAG: hypothetical protein OXD01_11355 [Gammaproteobacteria bacterium]|nr:hypothetical protein [Gammaproteobacteria bacterium]
MTNRFIDAASLMARVLGMPDYPFAVISHPVSSASDSELRESAQGVMAVLPELIVGSIKQTVITS